METIKEAAFDFARNSSDDLSLLIEYEERAFAAGVEFAQKLIPVDDELPPLKTWLILQDKDGYFTANYFNNSIELSDFIMYSAPVNWRPVERT